MRHKIMQSFASSGFRDGRETEFHLGQRRRVAIYQAELDVQTTVAPAAKLIALPTKSTAFVARCSSLPTKRTSAYSALVVDGEAETVIRPLVLNAGFRSLAKIHMSGFGSRGSRWLWRYWTVAWQTPTTERSA